ncbi:MAG: alpha/beta hydrolase [Opitutaceae bacterium]|nr:alpha/beta hydrolase [Opitutaceae bacterium]
MSTSALTRRDFIERASILSAIGALAANGAAAATRDLTAAARPQFSAGFRTIDIRTAEATIHGAIGGSGPPVLLLHGWPQTHLIWRAVAPRLARDFTVVVTDLRGYGDSSVPPDGENHEGYSKRAMARDQVEVMRSLGFERFAVIGHDRGGRVGHRMALDHPECVSKLAVIDIVPTLKLYTSVTKSFATAYWHWFFLIQPAPLPEDLLLKSAESFLRGRFKRSRKPGVSSASLIPDAISEETFAEYLRCFQDPRRMHAMCEDYRAGATIDLEHDRADLERKVGCPVLVLWGADNPGVDALFDVRATWRERATDVRGRSLPGGHYLPEQLPEAVHAECLRFIRPVDPGR